MGRSKRLGRPVRVYSGTKTHQRCITCYKTKPASEFHCRNQTKYLTSQCKSCRSLIRKARKYGLTVEEIIALPNSCEACGSDQDLHIDHDHTTGKYRGVLCAPCNRALGQLRDNLWKVHRLFMYLKEKSWAEG
jgi:hypothetical protein